MFIDKEKSQSKEPKVSLRYFCPDKRFSYPDQVCVVPKKDADIDLWDPLSPPLASGEKLPVTK